MQLREPLVDHGPLDMRRVRQALFEDGLFQITPIDQMIRRKMAGRRPGGAQILQTYRPITDTRSPAETFEMFQRNKNLPVLRNVHHAALWQVLERALFPQILTIYPKTELANVQITELPPKAEIPRHIDKFLLTQMHRLHVPLVTASDVVFEVDGHRFRLLPDRLYELDNTRPHAVTNGSDVTRLHLLIDLLPRAKGRVSVVKEGSDFHAGAVST